MFPWNKSQYIIFYMMLFSPILVYILLTILLKKLFFWALSSVKNSLEYSVEVWLAMALCMLALSVAVLYVLAAETMKY